MLAFLLLVCIMHIFYLTAYAVYGNLVFLFLHVPNAFIRFLSYFSNLHIFFLAVADGCIVLLDPPETTQSVTIDNDDEETTSAVTDFESAGRPTELSAKELYKVHLLRQIKKTDMDMDLIQLQLEEKRLAIKKAKLEIELLEHRLKDMKK